MSNVSIQFEQTRGNTAKFDQALLAGYRLACWLTAGRLQIRFQAVFHGHSTSSTDGGRGAPLPITTSGAIPEKEKPGILTITQLSGDGKKSKIVLRGVERDDECSLRIAANGYFARLITFVNKKDWADNMHGSNDKGELISRVDSDCVNVLTSEGTTAGLFEWADPINEIKASRLIFADGSGVPELGVVAPKPLKGDLDSSGKVVSFRTERTNENDVLRMILRQLCSGGINLDLFYRYNNEDEQPPCKIGNIPGQNKLVTSILYEQVHGRFMTAVPCWTSAKIESEKAKLLKLELDEVVGRGLPLSKNDDSHEAVVEDRVAFVFANDVDWPSATLVPKLKRKDVATK